MSRRRANAPRAGVEGRVRERSRMPRILLYTGKGGVGKTSVAAASAVLAAERGHRTIVLSTDIAHSLADALDLPLGPEPRQILPNLDAQEPDVFFNVERYWRTIQSYVATLFSWHGLDEVMAEEMTILPGMDELGSLLWIADHLESGNYDVIVVDAAPTGETLRLLSLPEASRWWVERIAPISRRVTKFGGPLIQRVIGVPVPDTNVFEAAEQLLARLDRVHRILADPDLSSVRLVLNLEKMSIAEAERSFTYFHLFGYPSDLVICNRVIPEGVAGYFGPMRAAQQQYLPRVREDFAPVPLRTIPWFDREMVGIDLLRELGAALFDQEDPTQIYYRGRPYSVRRAGKGYVLSLELPFTTREEIGLSRHGDELVIQVGTWRRTLVLPRALVDAPTTGARMEDSTLEIQFAARSPDGGTS
jgi:arsenite-transporting ATPase